MAETLILPLSATYFLRLLGLRGVRWPVIGFSSQLCGVFLAPPRIDGVTIGAWSGFCEPALIALNKAERMET